MTGGFGLPFHLENNMIDNLKKLEVYLVASKLYGRPLRITRDIVSCDLTSVKRGARLNNDLELHEAYFVELTKAGLLAPFRHYCADAHIWSADFRNISQTLKHLERSRKTLVDGGTGYGMTVADYDARIKAMEIAQKVEKQAQALYDSYGGKNIHWNHLTAVQFYCYDSASNSMVEFDHIVKPTKKVKP